MNKISIEVEKERVAEYEIRSLINDLPDFLIPMSFIEYDNCYSITYDYSGYVPMGNLEGCLTVRDIFDCMEAIVIAYRKAHLHLLFPDRLVLTKETVYIDRRARSIKILFVPQPPDSNIVPRDELRNFISQIQNMYITKEAHEYAEILKSYINENCGLRELQNRIVMIKREAFLCGIK